jgi:signal transduction histidine kinase
VIALNVAGNANDPPVQSPGRYDTVQQRAVVQPQQGQAAGNYANGNADQQQLQQQVQQADVPNQPAAQQWEPQQLAQAKQQREAMQQSIRNRQEYAARAANNSIQYTLQNAFNGNNYNADLSAIPPSADAAPAVMQAVWCGPAGDELVLARRVAAADGDAVQGCWVDWPAVRGWLLHASADLLPAARLEPVTSGAAEPGDARLLASLPVRLVPGELAASTNGGSSPLRLSLVVAWACVLLASAAVGGLLRGVVSLSERRGAFVSAVTHELRTPLTTLRMYTEMLEGGMVEDESQRRHYLGTLRAEADRLGHLVENVLAYSRLERHRATTSETVESPLGDLLARPVERLADRARQAGMTLDADLPDGVAAVRVRANPTSLEQILFNLVDNACKYAAGSDERTIHLTAARYGDEVRLTVRDHGPGIAHGREPRLFKAFSKSVQEAANSAPGLGLGLALSKRLAHAMGAKLTLDAGCRDGTCFVLTLPTA